MHAPLRVNYLDCVTSFALWIPLISRVYFPLILSKLKQAPKGGTSMVVYVDLCGSHAYIQHSSGDSSLVFGCPKRRLVWRFMVDWLPSPSPWCCSPCRFGAPERAVSTRFEIDSGTLKRVCARERVCVSMGCVCVRESNLSFCRSRPRDGVDRDLGSAVNVELAATEVAMPRPYYAITCRGKDARPFFADLIRRH